MIKEETTMKTNITYKVSNGIRRGERKTLEGAKALAEKFRKTSSNRVHIDMIYFNEETKQWESEDINNTTSNKEETAMMNINEIKTTFDFDGKTYTEKTNGYCFVTENGKNRRIKAAELETAFDCYIQAGVDAEQAILDEEPCQVEVDTDLYKPAVINQYGCVECRGCNVKSCVHRDCMRRNPRSEGGLGECPRLEVKPEDEQDVAGDGTPLTEVGKEIAEQAKEKAKKARKPRKSKDIAYEGHGVTLTAKQVDFIHHLPDTCFWENGVESTIWVDCLCDDIGGQFAGKPMTVGAMISTLCEKGLGFRTRDTLRQGKPIAFSLTDLGKEIAKELGLE